MLYGPRGGLALGQGVVTIRDFKRPQNPRPLLQKALEDTPRNPRSGTTRLNWRRGAGLWYSRSPSHLLREGFLQKGVGASSVALTLPLASCVTLGWWLSP